MLSEVAPAQGITIIGGSIPERDGGRLYDTCCVFGMDGKLKAKHRKVRNYIDVDFCISFYGMILSVLLCSFHKHEIQIMFLSVFAKPKIGHIEYL